MIKKFYRISIHYANNVWLDLCYKELYGKQKLVLGLCDSTQNKYDFKNQYNIVELYLK